MFARTDHALWTELDGQVVLFSLQRSHYYEVNAIGGVIWRLLDEPRSASDLVDHVVSQYRVERGQCAHDVGRFLDDLIAAGLVTHAVSASASGDDTLPTGA